MKNPALYKIYSIVEVRKENNHTSTLVLDKAIQFAQPGQFVMVWVPDVGERPFSIASADSFALTIAAVGPVSRALCALQLGGRIWVRGPLGHGFDLDGERHLLVGGGYGAAPLLYLSRQAVERGDEVCVCLGAAAKEDLLLVDAFRKAGCGVRIATEDGSAGQQGLVTRIVTDALDEFKADTLYACGPRPMLAALSKICREEKLPAQFSWETLLRCGIGLCGACEIDTGIAQEVGIPEGWLTCKDGPVSIHKNN